MFAAAGVFLKGVSARTWIFIGAAIVVGLLVWRVLAWHGDKVETFGNERYQAGYDARTAEIQALQDQLNAANIKIATEERKKSNEALSDNAWAADAVRVRGPGKAACPSLAFIPTGAGGHDQASRPADGSMDQVPDGGGEFIALPFTDTVDFAETHDAFRIEALAWRSWHARFTAEWADWQAKGKIPK